MNAHQEIQKNRARFDEILHRIEPLIAQGNLEQALRTAYEAASYAWMHSCGVFVSLELEGLLARISKEIPYIPLPKAPRSRRHIVTVMSGAYAIGGHSRIAWRWIGLDTASEHTLILTLQEGAPIPKQLLDLQRAGQLRIIELTGQSWLARIQALRPALADADCVVLLTHPNDVLVSSALPGMDTTPPVIFMDHASHAFWIGATISHLVLSMSGQQLEDRRGIPTQHIGWVPLPMDFARLDSTPAYDVRSELGIPSEATLLLTSGSDFKFWPIEGISLDRLITPVLEKHTSTHLLVVGVKPTAAWLHLSKCFSGRVHLKDYLPEPELIACYQACDIYLDALPIGSPTAMFEAAACGKPIVRYAPADWRKSTFSLEIDTIPTALYIWTTQKQYENDLDRLITDPAFRAWRGQFGYRAVRLYHADDTFVNSIEAAYTRVLELPLIEANVLPLEPHHHRLDELLIQLTRNHELSRTRQTGDQPFNPYVKWLQSRSNRILAVTSKPTETHLSVLLAGANGTNLEATQCALNTQLRAADQVLQPSVSGLAALRENGWVLLLNAGDTLETDALANLELALSDPSTQAAQIAYCDHDALGVDTLPESPHFKPDVNHDLLLSYPYMGRALAVRTDWAQPLLEQAGGVFDLVLAYRLTLKALRDAGPAGFLHVPAVLAHLSPNEPAVFAQTSETWQALAEVLDEHLQVTAPGAQIQEGPGPGTFHVIYPLERTPLVSIIVPTRDQLPFLSRCIDSLLSNTDYPAFEILIVDNDSQTPEAREFLAGLSALGTDQIRVLSAPGQFNFSRMNNLAVAQARGEFILLLNNDTAALQPEWLGHMVRHALRDGVGIVGARLLYPDGKVQHAGVIMGLRGPAEHPCLGLDNTEPGYLFRAQVTQNFSAVTAACMLVSKAVYEEVGGLDEVTFGVSYNDIDFCLRVGQTGRRIVWTPLATLLHEGSASQKAGIENKSQAQKVQRFGKEQEAMYLRWPAVIANDPAYNPNLSLVERGYEIETNPLLCFDKFQGVVKHRIAAFAADNQGCGNYRMLQPLQAMLNAGLCTGGASPEIFSPNLALRSGADTLIFQRPNSEVMLANLKALTPLKGIKKIYEVDDHLARVPIKSAHYEHMPKDLRGKMLKAIGLCDRLVVSTEPLARELRSYNGDVRVVLNRIPPAMWGAAPPQRASSAARAERRKPKVGWAGGIGHLGDLEMITGVIKDLADTVDWVFFGMCPDSIRPYVREFHTGIPTLEYPHKLMELAQDWDLAIAPLESNPFNDCKSNLKLLEYGWCGVPVVCSDVLPYQCDLPATRVKNRHKNWREAILERVTNLEASRQEGLALQQRIATDWMLTGDNLQRWYQAWTD